MTSTFTGFSEEDLKNIKSGDTKTNSGPQMNISNVKKLDRIGTKQKRVTKLYKLPILQTVNSDDAIDVAFDKCKLSIKSLSLTDAINNNNDKEKDGNIVLNEENKNCVNDTVDDIEDNMAVDSRKNSTEVKPDIVRSLSNYTEDELAAHRAKLEELQLRQKLMEEQNKKRKEMLAKALADRTRQTEEEVMKLEKIKKELQVLDGQFSLDVAVLRKKIDQACLTYAEAEKHYLKVEKEFLQAKINLQKEKEKKELLTEHLCALITHNETRKAQKLETLMLELANDKKLMMNDKVDVNEAPTVNDDVPVIVDGVDQKTGKIVELNSES